MNAENKKRTIKSHPDYAVSDCGEVYGKTNKLLKHDITHDGYHRVTLYKNNKPKHYPIHRLVAEAFIPNPEDKPTINHIDGNKANNSISNLEWSTRSENSQHAFDNGLNRCHFTDDDRRRAGITKAEKSSKPVRIIETGEIYPSARECARNKGLDSGNIAACCNSHRKSHHGLHFEWVLKESNR